MKLNYSYYNCKKYENQYSDYDLENEKIVKARYVHAVLDSDVGNPYIEALPFPRCDEDINDAYTQTLPTYDYTEVKNMDKFEKMLQISSLRQLRFPLSFHKTLEFSFYNSLLTSYRSRKVHNVVKGTVEYVINDGQQETSALLYGDSGASTNAGFSLIGYSGCGKSSALQTLLSQYPQTIIHENGEFNRYVLIVYLVVNCIPNSNFSALYESIGEAFDKALGNSTPVYQKEIAKSLNLGKKLEKVKELVERFGVGVIIFDEIQLINFEQSKDNSFEALMTLANRTKVAIAVVGTEDARDKMFKELRTARRIGTMINGDTYCDNKKFFTYLMSQMFQYQWFDEPVKLTNGIVEAFYKVTHGIIDQMIGIFICMQIDYLEKKVRPVVNADYVYEIANKYYPGIQNVLANLETVEAARKLSSIRNDADVVVSTILDKAKQEKDAEEIMQSKDTSVDNRLLLKNVIKNITMIYDEYSVFDIEKAFKSVMKNNKNATKTEREISKAVIEKLNKPTKTFTKKQKDNNIPTMDSIKMRSFVDTKGE